MSVFFYDSYAIIEYIQNNSRYVKYFEEHTGIITIFNLTEVYYSVLREAGVEKANEVFELLNSILFEPSPSMIKKAMQFRLTHKKKKLSYADCVGYQISMDKGIKFLTGDMQFESFSNVEYVK